MTAQDFICRLDHSVLRPDATLAELATAAADMIRDRYNSLTVAPWLVASASELLGPEGLAVGTVVAFPHGTSTLETKETEAEEAMRRGATLLDVVAPIGKLKSDKIGAFADELDRFRAAVLRAWRDIEPPAGAPPGITPTLRAILETGLLADDEADRAALAAVDAGWDFVKTSTGFGPRGATVDEVARLATLVRGRAKVKASGGIRSAESALAMFEAGADIVGTGSAPAIARELKELEASGRL